VVTGRWRTNVRLPGSGSGGPAIHEGLSLGARLLLTWALNVAALWVAARLLDGIDYRRGLDLVVAGLAFAIVNWLVKPVVTVLALPLIILTVGLGLFLVSLLMLYLTAWIAPGFRVDGFGDAVLGTIVIWAVNVVLRALVDPRRRRQDRRRRN
jgi:putative membrane protein